MRPSHAAVILLAAFSGLGSARAEEKTLNLYSARHYQTDERLYSAFTEQTGIRVNRIDGKEDELLERLRNEGARSPADVFITVDAARLGQAEALGLFAPIQSKAITERIPEHLRADRWAAFSTRARLIVYDHSKVDPGDVPTYESLADPKMKGKLCVRSGSHPYNLSLGAAMIAHEGEAKTEQWARGIVANLARPPKGGDTDQIRAVAAGECQVALANSYYLARLMRSDKREDQEVVARIGVVWPNQKSTGTHVNVSGAGILASAPHPEAALKFLEYLASDAAQAHFANGNNEWPAVKGVAVDNPALAKLGTFKADTLNVGTLSRSVSAAQKAFDRAGWR